MPSLRSLRLVPMGIALGACYTYAPVETRTVAAGANVRARITSTAAQRIGPLLGERDPRVLVGELVDRDANGLTLEVPTAAPVAVNAPVPALHQRIVLAPADITDLETRTLDRPRTAAIAIVAGVIAGSIAIAALRTNPGSDRPVTGSPPENRIPLLRFRF